MRQRITLSGSANTRHETLVRHAAQHVAVEHEGHASEHALDDDRLANDRADPLGQYRDAIVRTHAWAHFTCYLQVFNIKLQNASEFSMLFL